MQTAEHKSCFISRTHPEWPVAWEALAELTGDVAECNPVNGECWQYMGTERRDGWVHVFRDRDRPASRRGRNLGIGRVYVAIPASRDFQPSR